MLHLQCSEQPATAAVWHAGEVFSPHPERRGTTNRPSYVPVASPYDAQNPVARVERKVFARVRDVPQSVKKMNLVARVVRRMHIDDALVQMAYNNTKKSAQALHEVLHLLLCVMIGVATPLPLGWTSQRHL